MVDQNEVDKAKPALLRHYTSQQTSHGALIIGLIVALFTLLQVVQNTRTSPLSEIFPSIFPIWPSFLLKLKQLFFSLGIWFLISMLIYTVFRFNVYGRFLSALFALKASEEKKAT